MSVPPPMLAVPPVNGFNVPPPSMQSLDQINGAPTIVQQSTTIVTQSTPTMGIPSITATPVQTIAPPQNQPQIIQQVYHSQMAPGLSSTG